MKKVNLELNNKDLVLMEGIQERCKRLFPELDAEGLAMDVTAIHLNDTALRLKDLFQSDDFNFTHDILGITRHITRETGKLTNCFLPRFACRDN